MAFGFLFGRAQAQSPSAAVPLQFKVEDRGNNRILISWQQGLGDKIRQLSVQRSFDSTKMFKTIVTLPDPTLAANGYMDTKAPNDHMYYRIYLLLDSGQYLFSVSARPQKSNLSAQAGTEPSFRPSPVGGVNPARNGQSVVVQQKEGAPAAVIIPEKIFHVKRRDTLIVSLTERYVKAFRDSIRLKTKDTLLLVNADTFHLRPFIPKEIYKPSSYVFTDKEGPLKINLPEAPAKKYSILIFEMTGEKILEIKNIADKKLTIDKSHFGHAGWFRFELYEDGVLKEKHRFQIGRDF